MFSDVFVDRPRLAIVIAIVTTIAGGLALTKLPVSQFPDIVPPQVVVTASFPGASAAVVEATVAQPIEAQVNGVDQALYMKSNSGNDGSYSLTVSFALGTNPDIDTVNVNNRVQSALAKLPSIVQQGGVTVAKKSSAILEFLQFYSEGAKLSPLYVSNYVTINVLDTISRVPGVGQASLIGALNYSMRIWMNTDRMLALGLVPSDIQAAIQSQNIQGAVGRIGSKPTDDSTSFQVNLQTKGRLTTPEEFGNIVVRANPDGSVLRIRDVARVELGDAGIPAMVAHHADLYADLRDPVAVLKGKAPGNLRGAWPYSQSESPAEVGGAKVANYTALMSASQSFIAEEVLAAYDFRRHKCVMDVGGGDGTFLSHVAKAVPTIQLRLLDLPAVAAQAQARFAALGLGSRAQAIGGDAIHGGMPHGADLITFVRVLHDHNDDAVLAFLRNARAALAPGGTLLIAEPLAGTKGAEPIGHAYFGFYFLAMGQGRARTRSEMNALVEAAGFLATHEYKTDLPLLVRVLATVVPR